MAIPPAITQVCFPKPTCIQHSTPHPGLKETYKPIIQPNQIFSYFSYMQLEVETQEKVYFLDSARETSLTTTHH
jgi:hypothetical protein